MKDCPQCGLKHLNSAISCDCGSSFLKDTPANKSSVVAPQGVELPCCIAVSPRKVAFISKQRANKSIKYPAIFCVYVVAMAIKGVLRTKVREPLGVKLLLCLMVAFFAFAFFGGLTFILVYLANWLIELARKPEAAKLR
jgi:hypothetical protein